MDIKPIDVDIENPRLLGQLVHLIDREDFLNDIQEIRENKLKMNNLYNREIVEELYKYHYGNSLGLVTNDAFLLVIKRLSRKYKNVSKIPLSFDMPMSYTITEASNLLHKYNKNPGYLMAVVYAILCGKIKEGDYLLNTYPLFVTPETIKSVVFEPPFSYVTIVINPESTLDEVKEVFKRTYPIYFRSSKPLAISKDGKFKNVTPDTRNRIKDFRDWYWMNHKTNPNRMGYRKIAKMTGINTQTIISGIGAYSDFLKSSG